MKKRGIILLTAVAVILMFSGCGLDLGLSTVDITSVETDPDDNYLYDGSVYDFTIEVEYFNATLQTLDLLVAINNGAESDSYYHTDEEIQVDPFESGSHTFYVTAMAKDWGYTDDFGIMVNMITPEEPMFGDWSSTALDIYELPTTSSY